MKPNDELSIKAYKKIRSMIISKKLVPGQKIVQDKLAESLGISRTPLRSALQMLESEYLLESIPRKGMIVKEFNDKEIVEIYDCRMALEGTAVKLFAQIAKPTDIEGLKKLFYPFRENPENVHSSSYRLADIQFHDTIIKKCGNSYLDRLFRQGNLLVCIDLIGLVRPPIETLNEHIEIIEAIEKRDSQLAEILAKSHLDKSKQLILNRASNG